MRRSVRFVAALLLTAFAGACAGERNNATFWSQQSAPLPGPAEAIGFYTAGCLLGGEVLPPHGVGFQVMRSSRNRYYGHPRLLTFIHWLGSQADARGLRLLIGDLSQPAGGPMSYGHTSHQVGLDADIWLSTIDHDQLLNPQESQTRSMRSTVDRDRGAIRAARWTEQPELLQLAASYADVQRIFINPVIKQALCRSHAGQPWLSKLRPWWGHDAHFHVRLRCPPDSPDCQPQNEPPSVDGCDTALARWVTEQSNPPPAPAKPAKPRKKRPLPLRCDALSH